MKTSNKVGEKVHRIVVNEMGGCYPDMEEDLIALIEAEKALVLEEVLEQKKHYIVEFGFKNPNFEEAVPTKVIQKELDQVTQIIKGVKGIKE